MASCLSRHDQMVYSIFQNRAPRGIKFFQMTPKWRKVFIKMDWLLTMITNPFEIPIIQNLETFFFSFFYSKQNTILFRDKNKMINYFLYFFFKNSKHIFCFDKSQFFSNLNDVMKFINTKTKKLLFFQFFLFLQKNPQHVYLLYHQPAKRSVRTDVSLHVS